MKTMFSFWAILVLCIGLLSCNSGASNISSIEEAKNYISGKTFTATPSGEMWYKVSFSNSGTFTLWSSTPQSGSWGSPTLSGRYTVNQNRYSDTGERYFYATLDKEHDGFVASLHCMQFIINDLSLVNCSAYNMNDRTKVKEGDRNPW